MRVRVTLVELLPLALVHACVILFVLAGLMLCVLLDYDFFHLLDGDCTLNVHPLVLNHVLFSKLEDQVHTADVFKSDKAESARLLGPFILQNYTILQLPKITKVSLESGQL
jgi:hypothetical protein